MSNLIEISQCVCGKTSRLDVEHGHGFSIAIYIRCACGMEESDVSSEIGWESSTMTIEDFTNKVITQWNYRIYTYERHIISKYEEGKWKAVSTQYIPEDLV
jgi:hypothetical protein